MRPSTVPVRWFPIPVPALKAGEPGTSWGVRFLEPVPNHGNHGNQSGDGEP